jgi:tetratricopeptide (TPR) repeat protein
MKNHFTKSITVSIVFLTCHGCTFLGPISKVFSKTPRCLESLPRVPISAKDKDKSSEEVEVEADKLEEEGRGRESLNRYGETYTIYAEELKRFAMEIAIEKADPNEIDNINPSLVDTPEHIFKVGRAFAQNNQNQVAINCFTEVLDKKIAAPNDAIAYLNRGDSYEKIGIKNKARDDFRLAVNLFKKHNQPSYQKIAEQRLQAVQ